ncbi:cobalt-precorrin 5A hydrolase [Vibrio albus]|uniref:cobalt-precorrin 5A hydrolase n=1 Tax=Vibrio albus TaxID=2200953 RepID=UPI001C633F0A|nr:cobalt-precorrin 5A hydrolase [Vibrio albus]
MANKLRDSLPITCYCAEKYVQDGFIPFNGSFQNTVAESFSRDSAIIVVGACGITVRVIAPLLEDKLSDPAVLVVDEKGEHVISLLSGHMGGANALARYVSGIIGAKPVITTSTDVNQKCSFDLLAKQMCAVAEDFRTVAKTINQRLVSGENIGLFVDPWLVEHLGFDIDSFDTRGLTFVSEEDVDKHDLSALIDVSMQLKRPEWPVKSYQLIPKRVVAGIGCRKDTSPGDLAALFSEQLMNRGLHSMSLAVIGSIDVKKDEPAILKLASGKNVPFKVFSAEELRACSELFPKSEFVIRTVGIGSVSQPAAWLLSNGLLLGETVKQQGITITYGVMK